MERLFIFSANYPFDIGEDFLDKEIGELKKRFEIILLPQEKRSENGKRENYGYILDESLVNTEKGTNSLLFKYFRISIAVFFTELFQSRKSRYIIANLRWFFSILKSSLLKAEKIEEMLSGYDYNQTKDSLYAVWMDESSISLSILKKQKKIRSFSFRLHGYDLFDERRDGNYMPFRSFCFNSVKTVFTLSDEGTKYLLNKFPKKSIKTSYSGLYDHGLIPLKKDENIFELVSCANLIPLKRVHKIINSLCSCKRKVNWTHFGDGPLSDEIKELSKSLPSNIKCNLRGRVPNEKLIEYYLSTHVDLFLHVSESEGLGMALVEAHSFGVPVVACDVGGVRNVVVEGTGLLLPVDVCDSELARIIENWEEIMRKNKVSSVECRKHFMKRFSAVDNYKIFGQLLRDN